IIGEMNFKGLAKAVYGCDPDERVLANPFLDKKYVGVGSQMPFFDDQQFDLVISSNVLEHIKSDEREPFFREINRVLRPGGFYITKTPNAFHYAPLIAQVTPTSFHRFSSKMRGACEDDVFPTYYGFNTKKRQTKVALRTGFSVKEMHFFEGRPEYMRAMLPAYLLGVLYERAVNKLKLDF